MNVRVYFNTGFNAVNIPDTPALLDSGAFTITDFPAIDILQERFLSSIRIRATWNQIKNGDYCRITDTSDNYDFYYVIDGISMKSKDVAELHLVPDFITSAGGLENCDILDGVATRCHVDDDTYGAWELDDEYLTPSEPLLMDTATVKFDQRTNLNVVESSLDLGLMATIATADGFSDDQGEKVMVPKAYTTISETEYSLDGRTLNDMRTMVFPLSSKTVREGIEMCRALGIESAVVNTAVIPNDLVIPGAQNESVAYSQQGQATNSMGSISRTLKGDFDSGLSESWPVYESLTSNFVEKDSGLLFEYDNTVKNKRVLYGNINKVGILTTAGNRLESNPENLTGGGETTIKIKSVGDPHTNGCPYHRFKYMDGNASNEAFWINAVKGLQWKQIPLVYASKSGSILDRINFENSRAIQDINFNNSPAGLLKSFGESMGGTDRETEFLAGALGGIGAGLFSASLGPGAILGAGAGFIGGATSYRRAVDSYAQAKRAEQQQFAIGQNVVAPQISVSYDGEAYRDFYGECVIVYRYRPRPTDLARMDKILTMYGYRLNIPAPDAPLHNRDYFNYIQASITVGGSLPKWLADGVAIQVSNGVRLWHVKPNSTYYNNNPIST